MEKLPKMGLGSRSPTAATGNSSPSRDLEGHNRENDLQNTENNIQGAKLKQSKRKRLCHHCMRFWLWYLVAAVILAAILLPLLFKVIIPAIVQSLVSKQALPISGGALVVLGPDLVNISLYTSLDVPLPVSIDTTSLHLYNKDTPDYSPFINVTLAGQAVSGKTEISVVNQTQPLANESETIRWLGEVVDGNEVDVSLRSIVPIRLGALYFTPLLEKTLTLPGLRKLAGMNIDKLKLNLSAPKNASNAEGTVVIPNWGNLDLFLGNTTFDLFSGDLKIGSAGVNNLWLYRGNNTCNFTGTIELPTILQNVGKIFQQQAQAIKDGKLELGARVSQVLIDNQHINIIESVLRPRVVQVTASVISLLTDIVGGILPSAGNNTANALGNALGILGNKTLLQGALDHWNRTKSQEKRQILTPMGELEGFMEHILKEEVLQARS